jgi:hypothetical protein
MNALLRNDESGRGETKTALSPHNMQRFTGKDMDPTALELILFHSRLF